jgi:GT2 family glycosyltransferase
MEQVMTRESPLVSVIIPSYNSSRTLRLCLRSVAAQTYSPIEVIVVDDGSTDDSALIAESSGVTVLRVPVNSGQSAARNLGAQHARGRVFFFLDSDVALDSGGVQAAVTAFESEPALGAISGVYDFEPLLSTGLTAQYRALQMNLWWSEGPKAGPHMGLFAIRAEVFDDVGPFNPHLRHTEPQEYGYRLRKRHQTQVMPEIHGQHAHDTSMRVLLPKVFRRARASMLEWRQGEELGGAHDAPSRVLSSGLVLGALVTSPLPLLVGTAGAVVSPVLIAVAIALDAGTYRHVFARRGVPFGLYFVAAHLLFQLTAAAGAAAGALDRLRRRPAPRTAKLAVPTEE